MVKHTYLCNNTAYTFSIEFGAKIDIFMSFLRVVAVVADLGWYFGTGR